MKASNDRTHLRNKKWNKGKAAQLQRMSFFSASHRKHATNISTYTKAEHASLSEPDQTEKQALE